jgi:hypothetical protein
MKGIGKSWEKDWIITQTWVKKDCQFFIMTASSVEEGAGMLGVL